MSRPATALELPREVPRPGPVPPLRVGKPARARLAGGTDVMVVARPSVPRVELRLTLPAGAAVGHSRATSQLLRAGILLGTARLSQEQVSEEVQRLGGALQVQQDQDRVQISASALAEAEEELYRLVFEVATEPAFPAADLETERVRLIEGLRIARATPRFVAEEELQRLVYGAHPYGQSEPTETQLRRAGPAQLRRLHQQTFIPAAAQLTVVGDVEPRRTIERLRRTFGAWRGPRRAPSIPRVPHRVPPATVQFIARPGLVQTVIAAGCTAPPVGHPDQIALGLAVALLGGSFSSRLMTNLRESKGYSYTPRTYAQAHRQDTLAFTELEVRTEVTAAAYVELGYELGRLAAVPVEPEELEESRNYLSGVRVIALQTQAGLANSLAQVRAYGLDQRYLETYSQRLTAIGPADLRRVAARYLGPSAQATVMVGDPAALADLRQVAAVSPRRR